MLNKSESLYLLYILIVLVSCQSKKIDNNKPDLKIETIELRNKFLEEIYDSDQCNRAQFSSSDFTDDQKHDFWKTASKTDSFNLIQIDFYLNQFGYPDTVSYTKKLEKRLGI